VEDKGRVAAGGELIGRAERGRRERGTGNRRDEEAEWKRREKMWSGRRRRKTGTEGKFDWCGERKGVSVCVRENACAEETFFFCRRLCTGEKNFINSPNPHAGKVPLRQTKQNLSAGGHRDSSIPYSAAGFETFR